MLYCSHLAHCTSAWTFIDKSDEAFIHATKYYMQSNTDEDRGNHPEAGICLVLQNFTLHATVSWATPSPLNRVRLFRNAPGIVPAAQIFYKFDKQSRLESFQEGFPPTERCFVSDAMCQETKGVKYEQSGAFFQMHVCRETRKREESWGRRCRL